MKKVIKINIVFFIILVVASVCAAEICASPIQEGEANNIMDANVAEISASLDIVAEAKHDIVEDTPVDIRIISKYIEAVPLENIPETEDEKILEEYYNSYKSIGQYPLDHFQEILNALRIPSYTLAEDFPKEHIKTFNDFLLFSASIAARRTILEGRYSIPDVFKEVIFEHQLVKMRLEQNNPVQYEDFLSAVLLSLSSYLQDYGMFNHFCLSDHYIMTFMYPSRNTLFVENVIEPLSHDLANVKYRGYRFKSNDLPQFFRDFAVNCFDRRMEAELLAKKRYSVGFTYPPFTLRLPQEFYLLNYYAETFLLVHMFSEELGQAYRLLYSYKMPRTIYRRPNIIRPDSYRTSATISPEKRRLPLLPPRPYYYYSDDDRYQWFCYLQEELRSAGRSDYADSILEAETEHYRELIIWQLQLRAYLTEKLFEYGDISNLSTLKELLTSEYTSLKNNPEFQTIFENAIEALRDMDDKVQSTSPIDTAKGEIILPWIDRAAIDKKQGIETEVLTIQQNPITWKIAIEEIDDETKEEMKNSYEKSIYYIRVLAVISEKLNKENDLETMVQFHSTLASNTNVNCTPTGIYHQDFSGEKDTNGDGEKKQTLDSQTELDPRYYQSNILPQPVSLNRYRISFIEEYTIKDSEDISETVMNTQAKLDQRRYDLIVNDFWGWQERRKNGDMTVGEIILPWIAVQDK